MGKAQALFEAAKKDKRSELHDRMDMEKEALAKLDAQIKDLHQSLPGIEDHKARFQEKQKMQKLMHQRQELQTKLHMEWEKKRNSKGSKLAPVEPSKVHRIEKKMGEGKVSKLLGLVGVSEDLMLKDFDKHDWDGFAGAERPDENTPPKIGEIEVEMTKSGKNMTVYGTVVVDAHGIQIMFIGDSADSTNYDEHGFMDLDMPDFERAVAFAQDNLHDGITYKELQDLGFEHHNAEDAEYS
jgi:hypothetical protein